MRDDVPDINSAKVVPDVDDETVAIATDVEHHFGWTDKIRARKVPSYLQMLRVVFSPDDPCPVPQTLSGVLVFARKLR